MNAIININTQKQLVLSVSILLSLCLHIAGLLLVAEPMLRPATKTHRLPEQMVLQFIHTPEQTPEKEPLQKTNIISEMNTQSQNIIRKETIINKDPYQEGKHEEKSLLQTESFASQNVFIPEKPEIQQQEKIDINETPLYESQTHTPPTPTKEDPSLTNQTSLKLDEIPSPRSKNIHSSSEIMNEYRYNAQSSDVARYLSKELKNIAHVWRLSILTETVLPTRLNRTVIAFKIMDDGHYTQMRILSHKGDIVTQNYALNAIKKVAPFTPLPDSVKSYIRDDGLWVIIDFNYKD